MSENILDSAIKFGAGRYRQDRNLLEKCGEEIRRFGKKVFIVAGPRAFAAVKDRLLPGLERAGLEYVIAIYEGVCSYEAAEEYGRQCIAAGCDQVVGVGGGRIMDFSKALAENAGLGTVNIPTSIATCAAFTAMSVMYTPEGAQKDSWRYEHQVDAVLVDLDIIAGCPGRYAAAGILDAMAKKIEMQNGKPVMRPQDNCFDLYTAFRISEYTYEMLELYGRQAVEDIKQKKVTKEVEYVTFINIAITGIIANITRSFNQSALAHMMYYGIKTYFPQTDSPALHGEIVAVGLFAQLRYNQMNSETDRLAEFMRRMHMPVSLRDIGIEATEENLNILEEYLFHSPYVEQTREGRALLHEAMKCYMV